MKPAASAWVHFLPPTFPASAFAEIERQIFLNGVWVSHPWMSVPAHPQLFSLFIRLISGTWVAQPYL